MFIITHAAHLMQEACPAGAQVFDISNDSSLTSHCVVESKNAPSDVRSLKGTLGDYIFLTGANPKLKLSEQQGLKALLKSPMFIVEAQSEPKTVNQARMKWFLTMHVQVG
jgi:hypothetical protein